MSTDRNYKRKRFFNYSIKRRLQLRMLVKIWLIVFVSLLFASLVFYFYGDKNVGESYRLFHVKAKNFLDFLLPVLVGGFFSSVVLGVIVALFFPHAFAGPLYRIEKELADIGNGNLATVIRLRKGSEVQDLAEALNAMVAGLRDKIKKIDAAADEVGKLVGRASPEDGEQALTALKEAHGRLQASIKGFQV